MTEAASPQVLNIDELKSGGLLAQKQGNLFAVRLRVVVGNISTAQLRRVAELADRYGRGEVHLTVRQGIEIPYVPFEDIAAVKKGLEEVGLTLGACGPRVRVVTACQGTRLCRQSVGDAPALATKLDERYYGQSDLPHKVKIAVTGCVNSCAKPQENDIGFTAVVEPTLDESEGRDCMGCGLCADICPSGAITLVDDKPVIDLEKCRNDGKCIHVCPSESLQPARQGWDVCVGGKFGAHPRLGELLTCFVDEQEAVDLTGRIIEAYRRLGNKRERLGELIDRVGLDAFRKEVG